MLYCSNRIKRNFKIKVRQFAPTLEDRNNNLGRYALNSIIKFVHEPCEMRSKDVLRSFLTKAANKYSTFTGFLHFAKSVDRLNNFYKNRLKIKAMNEYVLDKMWEKSYINITQNNMLGKGKSKKVSKLMKKIYAISNETKAKVLKVFCDHRILEFKIKFVLYRRRILENKGE